jgi:hypothetical protein
VAVDPDETKNLAAAHPDVVKALQADLDGWWRPQAPAAAAGHAAVGHRRVQAFPVAARLTTAR